MIERPFGSYFVGHFELDNFVSDKAKVMSAMICASIDIRGFEWNFRRFIKIIFCYDNLLAVICKTVNLIRSGQYFSLERVIFGMNAKFSIRMMLSPNSTLDVRMDFSLPEWSLDYFSDVEQDRVTIVQLATYQRSCNCFSNG